jgi:hypothetical protein
VYIATLFGLDANLVSTQQDVVVCRRRQVDGGVDPSSQVLVSGWQLFGELARPMYSVLTPPIFIRSTIYIYDVSCSVNR